VQRAARRHTDQGRVRPRQIVPPEQQQQHQQQPQKRGPAEAFLATLQERLYNSRNTKCASSAPPHVCRASQTLPPACVRPFCVLLFCV
jgi:hypothetical protein